MFCCKPGCYSKTKHLFWMDGGFVWFNGKYMKQAFFQLYIESKLQNVCDYSIQMLNGQDKTLAE